MDYGRFNFALFIQKASVVLAQECGGKNVFFRGKVDLVSLSIPQNTSTDLPGY
jgi:hypothetical protein